MVILIPPKQHHFTIPSCLNEWDEIIQPPQYTQLETNRSFPFFIEGTWLQWFKFISITMPG